PWDESLARAWLPLDEWTRDFLAGSRLPLYPPVGGAKTPTAQVLDEQNWLSRQAHLRRVMIDVEVDNQQVVAPGQQGRICPVETPEGRNIGRILSLSQGAVIRDGRIEIVDDSPAAALGLSASMIPLIEFDDPGRCLMGANMMRQWVTPTAPEPALVRTGDEPDEPGFWCGWNLLTAFISAGGDTHDDGIVVSESAVKRMALPHTLEVGDKLSNRHGTKGTIARILPDEQMPHLPDGTAAELVFSFLGCHTRLNFGQMREAVLGRIARAKGEPIICPPFEGPSAEPTCPRRRSTPPPASPGATARGGWNTTPCGTSARSRPSPRRTICGPWTVPTPKSWPPAWRPGPSSRCRRRRRSSPTCPAVSPWPASGWSWRTSSSRSASPGRRGWCQSWPARWPTRGCPEPSWTQSGTVRSFATRPNWPKPTSG
ncbi:MAG: hypothetical protein ACYS5V_17570, partial [Planctomycetota bacterium]